MARSAGGKAEEKGSGTRGGGALSTLLRRAHRKSPEPGSKREEAVYILWLGREMEISVGPRREGLDRSL